MLQTQNTVSLSRCWYFWFAIVVTVTQGVTPYISQSTVSPRLGSITEKEPALLPRRHGEERGPDTRERRKSSLSFALHFTSFSLRSWRDSGAPRKFAKPRVRFSSTPRQSPRGFTAHVHGFAAKTKALARKIAIPY